MIEHILVATDFSTRSDRAIRRATLLAAQLEATLTLAHVVDDDQPPHLVEVHVNACHQILAENAETITNFDQVPTRSKIVTGDAYSGLLEAAEECSADLIVVGPHRRSIRDVFVGTTAERTVAHSNLPVLMAAGVPSAPYDRALVAVDIESGSSTAASFVRDAEFLTNVDLVALYAFDGPGVRRLERTMVQQDFTDQYVDEIESKARQDFRIFASVNGLADARKRALPIKGTAARTIIETAQEENASLIVVGTSQPHGIKRVIVGSTAENVLSDTDRDVLVIPKGAVQ